MWNWITVNSIWFLTGAAILFIITIIIRNRFRDKVAKLKPDKRDTRGNRIVQRSLLAVVYLSIAIMLTSFIAIIDSQEESTAAVTPEAIQEWLLTHGIIIIAYIAVAYFIYQIIKKLLPRLVLSFVKSSGKGRHSKSWFDKRAKTLTEMIIWIVAILIGLITFFLVLDKLGQDITPLLASAGIVGVALALGAQSLVKDFLGGMFILLEDQYNVGDTVKIAGISGAVEELNLRRTVLRDLDGIVHTIPNSSITTASNYTRDLARVNLDIPVSYSQDLDKVFSIMNRVGKELAEDPYFSKLIITPPQVLRVQKLGDSGIDIRILGDVHASMQWEVTGELRKRLKKAFDTEGIEIPWRPNIKLVDGDKKDNNKEDLVSCKNCSFANQKDNSYCGKCGEKLGE